MINEIMPAPKTGEKEFVEFYNTGDKLVNLEKWRLRDKNLEDKSASEHKDASCLLPELEVFPKKYALFYLKNCTGKNYAIILNNDSDELNLYNPADLEPISSVFYLNAKSNYSYSFDGTDWQWTSFSTPGKENEFDKLPEPIVYSDKIIINELLPKPDPENILYKEEFVELFNGGDTDEKLDGWFLKDRTGKKCELSGETMESGNFLVVKHNPDKKCTLALNDTQGEFLGLYSPADKDKPVSSVSYEGSAKKGKSYSFDGENWRWSQYLTPKEDNLFNNLPIVSSKKENKIYVGVYAQFSAKASDKDREKLKFTWDFGDGHKSYLQNTRHKYEKAGNYTATLKVSDGNEDVFKTFKIKVIKFPKIKLNIKEIMPNPKGLDTKEDGEYIVIKNESDKKINLKGWSIATGSKNLYNHPITEDLVLKPGQSKKITRKYSKFALANQKCKIEIRYPNGKVAYTLKYEKDKIAEDEIYKKVDGKWIWIAPLIENKLALTETSIENNPIVESADTEIQTNLGKYSESPVWQKKKENKIILASYATNLTLPDTLESQPRILGASTVRSESEYFAFGRPYVPEPHWAVTFINYLAETLNSTLNNALNFFS